MHQIIFVSSSPHLLNQKELDSVMERTMQQSKELNITGLLLYKDGNFLGVLEGEDWAVKRRYDDARQNCLSTGAIIIDESAIEERQFSDWRMVILDKVVARFFSAEQLKNDKNGSMHMLNEFVATMR